MGPQDNDRLIAAGLWADHTNREALKTTCDWCGAEIGVGPKTLEKQGQKGWHVICTPCLGKQAVIENSAGTPMPFKGRYVVGDTKAPWEK